jgi:hypothetical protein
VGLRRETNAADPNPIDERALDQAYRRYQQRKIIIAVLTTLVVVALAGFLIMALIQSGRLGVPIANLPPTSVPATGDTTPTTVSAEIVATNTASIVETAQPTFTPAVAAAQSQATATALPAETVIPPTQARTMKAPQAITPSSTPIRTPTRVVPSPTRAAPSPTPLPKATKVLPGSLPPTGSESDNRLPIEALGLMVIGSVFILSLAWLGRRDARRAR